MITAKGGYRDLDVYRLSHDLGVQVHRFSRCLPKYEMFESGSQMRRSAQSISANIVEGYGRRRYKAEFIRFLVYAQASCDETIEWLEYAGDNHEDHRQDTERLLKAADELGRKLNRFIESVERQHNDFAS